MPCHGLQSIHGVRSHRIGCEPVARNSSRMLDGRRGYPVSPAIAAHRPYFRYASNGPLPNRRQMRISSSNRPGRLAPSTTKRSDAGNTQLSYGLTACKTHCFHKDPQSSGLELSLPYINDLLSGFPILFGNRPEFQPYSPKSNMEYRTRFTKPAWETHYETEGRPAEVDRNE